MLSRELHNKYDVRRKVQYLRNMYLIHTHTHTQPYQYAVFFLLASQKLYFTIRTNRH